MSKTQTKAILLVAGEGKRLRPYTLDRPKCMVEIDEISLLERQISVLHSENIENILMIGGYKAKVLPKNIRLRINTKFSETNMVWTLFTAEDELDGDLIIGYGDIVYSKKILKKLLDSRSDISVIIDKEWELYWRARNEDPLDDAETLKLDKNGLIREIGKKPDNIEDIEGQYIGLMRFNDSGIRILKQVYNNIKNSNQVSKDSLKNLYMTDLLQAVIDDGHSVQSILVNESWVEVDTVSDFHNKVTSHRLEKIKKELEEENE